MVPSTIQIDKEKHKSSSSDEEHSVSSSELDSVLEGLEQALNEIDVPEKKVSKKRIVQPVEEDSEEIIQVIKKRKRVVVE